MEDLTHYRFYQEVVSQIISSLWIKSVDSAIGGQTQADLAKPVKQGLILFF